MSKPLPILSHMPWNVLQLIVDETDFISRLNLRKCSRKLRTIVDSTEFAIDSITVRLDNLLISLEIQYWESQKQVDLSIEYHVHPVGCVRKYNDREQLFDNLEHPIALAVADLAALVNIRKLEVDHLNFEQNPSPLTFYLPPPDQKTRDVAALFVHLKGKFTRKLSISELDIDFAVSIEQLKCLLEHIHSGTSLRIKLRKNHENIDELTGTEHWKRARLLNLEADEYPIDKMAHFKLCFLRNPPISVQDVKIVVENALKHGAEFGMAYFRGVRYDDYPEVCRYLSQNLYRDDGKVRHYRIRGEHFNFEIKTTLEEFRIECDESRRWISWMN